MLYVYAPHPPHTTVAHTLHPNMQQAGPKEILESGEALGDRLPLWQ